MFTPSDREIEKFFEHLTPEDFASTPTETHLSARTEERPVSGPEDFEHFVLDNLRELVDDEGENEIAILHDGLTARLYHQRPEESAGEWLVRVSKDASEHNAKWTFLGMPGEASVGDPEGMFDPADDNDVKRARASGYLIEAVNWYAESVEAAHEEIRFGVIVYENNGVRIVQSTNPTGANPAFRRVLHP